MSDMIYDCTDDIDIHSKSNRDKKPNPNKNNIYIYIYIYIFRVGLGSPLPIPPSEGGGLSRWLLTTRGLQENLASRESGVERCSYAGFASISRTYASEIHKHVVVVCLRHVM